MSYFPILSCVALMKIYSKPYSVLIFNNYKCYKLYRIYLYNFTQVRSSYAWKSQEYYIHHSNIIILGTRESEEKNTAMRNIGPLLTANAADQICELYLA